LNLVSVAVDAIRIPQIMRIGLEKMIAIEGREHLDCDLKKGRGAILLTGHFGNWELFEGWAARNGYKLRVV